MIQLRPIATICLLVSSIGQCCPAFAQSFSEDRFLIRVSVDKNRLVGHPLAWDEQSFVLLRRDGSVYTYPIDHVSEFSKLDLRFQPYSEGQMEKRLRAEFGDDYQVTRTENYLVVHPRRSDNRWGRTFENMFRQFKHYASVRGCSIKSPEFPLVAIVFKTRNEFDRYSQKRGTRITRQVVGYYSLESNRIITYDQDSRNSKGEIIDNSTVIHEAAHQAAFNTGVHGRFAPPPKWASEGLAVMFEAPGVHYSSRYSNREDRIHQNRLAELKSHIARGNHKNQLLKMVESDQLFSTNPSLAYSLSWGLSFYFAETQSRDYFAYLKDTSKRKAFSSYSRHQRKRDFTKRFGDNFQMLEKRLERFIDEL